MVADSWNTLILCYTDINDLSTSLYYHYTEQANCTLDFIDNSHQVAASNSTPLLRIIVKLIVKIFVYPTQSMSNFIFSFLN